MSLFRKKARPKPRTFEIPPKDIPNVLRLVDDLQAKKGGLLPRYQFWEEIERIVPGTKGINLRVNFRGAVPYLEEVLS
jgi:hypothetical protein